MQGGGHFSPVHVNSMQVSRSEDRSGPCSEAAFDERHAST